MNRPIRNAKQPYRFNDMVPLATSSSSENDPPMKKRLFMDSETSMKDNIQELKLKMANRSFLDSNQTKQNNRKLSQHSRTNSSLTLSLSKADLSDDACRTNRSPTPLSKADHSDDEYSRTNNLSPTLSLSIADRSDEESSRHNRSFTPLSKAADRSDDEHSRINRSLTPLYRISSKRSNINRSSTSLSQQDRTSSKRSDTNRFLNSLSQQDRTSSKRSETNRFSTSLSQQDRTSNKRSETNRSSTSLSQQDRTFNKRSETNRSSTSLSQQDRTSSKHSDINRFSTTRLDCAAKRKNHSNSQRTDHSELTFSHASSDSFSNIKKPLISAHSKTFQQRMSSENSSKTRNPQTTTHSTKSLNPPHISLNDNLLSIQSDIQNIAQQLADLPKKIADIFRTTLHDEVRRAVKAAIIKNSKIPCKPACLPFRSAADINEFDRQPKEEYDEVVSYLSHVGGWTARSCANAMFKEAADDEVFLDFTFTGFQKKKAFEDLRFAKACEEAMAANPNFTLTKTIFKDAITEALRASKQRLRNRQADVPVRRVRNNSGQQDSDFSDLE